MDTARAHTSTTLLPSTVSSSSSSSTPTPPAIQAPPSPSSWSRRAASSPNTGIIIGCIAGISTVTLALNYFWRRDRQRTQRLLEAEREAAKLKRELQAAKAQSAASTSVIDSEQSVRSLPSDLGTSSREQTVTRAHPSLSSDDDDIDPDNPSSVALPTLLPNCGIFTPSELLSTDGSSNKSGTTVTISAESRPLSHTSSTISSGKHHGSSRGTTPQHIDSIDAPLSDVSGGGYHYRSVASVASSTNVSSSSAISPQLHRVGTARPGGSDNFISTRSRNVGRRSSQILNDPSAATMPPSEETSKMFSPDEALSLDFSPASISDVQPPLALSRPDEHEPVKHISVVLTPIEMAEGTEPPGSSDDVEDGTEENLSYHSENADSLIMVPGSPPTKRASEAQPSGIAFSTLDTSELDGELNDDSSVTKRPSETNPTRSQPATSDTARNKSDSPSRSHGSEESAKTLIEFSAAQSPHSARSPKASTLIVARAAVGSGGAQRQGDRNESTGGDTASVAGDKDFSPLLAHTQESFDIPGTGEHSQMINNTNHSNTLTPSMQSTQTLTPPPQSLHHHHGGGANSHLTVNTSLSASSNPHDLEAAINQHSVGSVKSVGSSQDTTRAPTIKSTGTAEGGGGGGGSGLAPQDQAHTSSNIHSQVSASHTSQLSINVDPLPVPAGMWSMSSIADLGMEPMIVGFRNSDTPMSMSSQASMYSAASATRLSSATTKKAPSSYKRGRKIAHGAHSKVYVCLNEDTGRMMAAKVINFSETDPHLEQRVAKTAREIRMLKMLKHEHIVNYYHAIKGADGRSMQIFTEYVPNGNLRSTLQQFGGLRPHVASSYVEQLLTAIRYLHCEMNTAHLDLKCSNILITPEGFVKLADFGSTVGFSADLLPSYMRSGSHSGNNSLYQGGGFVGSMSLEDNPIPHAALAAAVPPFAISRNPDPESPQQPPLVSLCDSASQQTSPNAPDAAATSFSPLAASATANRTLSDATATTNTVDGTPQRSQAVTPPHGTRYVAINEECGTVTHMAPEVIRAEVFDPAACDIWALGCTVVEMLSGKNPWDDVAKERFDLLHRVGSMSPSANHLPDAFAASLECISENPIATNFVKICLHPNPKMRPTVVELMAHPFARTFAEVMAESCTESRSNCGSLMNTPLVTPKGNEALTQARRARTGSGGHPPFMGASMNMLSRETTPPTTGNSSSNLHRPGGTHTPHSHDGIGGPGGNVVGVFKRSASASLSPPSLRPQATDGSSQAPPPLHPSNFMGHGGSGSSGSTQGSSQQGSLSSATLPHHYQQHHHQQYASSPNNNHNHTPGSQHQHGHHLHHFPRMLVHQQRSSSNSIPSGSGHLENFSVGGGGTHSPLIDRSGSPSQLRDDRDDTNGNGNGHGHPMRRRSIELMNHSIGDTSSRILHRHDSSKDPSTVGMGAVSNNSMPSNASISLETGPLLSGVVTFTSTRTTSPPPPVSASPTQQFVAQSSMENDEE